MGQFGQFGFGDSGGFGTPDLEVATPVMLPIAGAHKHVRGNRGYAVFLNSRGEVTAYDYYGVKAWQVALGLTWNNHGSHVEGHKSVPTLEAISLRRGGLPTLILAAGNHLAAIISDQGHVLDTFNLPEPPAIPIQLADFNGDGYNDLIMMSRGGVFAYSQMRHPGGVPFSALLGCLMVVMGGVYFTQASPQAARRGAVKGRSTDRID
jgi:hypothetical protein